MSYASRQEKGRLLCQKLAETVAHIAPTGIGRWDRCWQIVDPPSAGFMLALSAWETSPSNDAAMDVSSAYDDVLDAWRQASSEYTTEGAA